MPPLTIDDLLWLLGQKEATILQLQRELARLTAVTPELNGQVVPVAVPHGER